MITYNGIELDYQSDALNSLVIKGGLTKIENLTDRTGTSSTQFNLPRTAKNELAFGNITTEGAQSQTSGTAYITIDGNIFSVGTLYVTGYDNDNFKCLFMGQDNDLIATLKTKPLKSLMDVNNIFSFSDTNIRYYIENMAPASLGSEVTFHMGSGFFYYLEDNGILDRNHVAPFFQVRSMLYKLFKAEGYDLISNFFDSDYGRALDYSNFGGIEDLLSDNYFSGASNSLPSSVTLTSSKDYYDDIDIGTGGVNNGSITYIGGQINLSNDCESLNFSGSIDCTLIDEIESIQMVISVYRPSLLSYVFYSIGVPFGSFPNIPATNNLVNGVNYFNQTINASFLANDEIRFMYNATFKDTGTFNLSSANLTCTELHIANDNIQLNDGVWVGHYLNDQNQYEFLKGILKDLNLVMDVNGSNVYIELQDEGVEPIGLNPASLPSIGEEQYNIDDIVLDNTAVAIEYVQADLIYLNQTKQTDNYVDALKYFNYQDWGSTFYKLNSFNNNRVEEIKSYFKAYYDGSNYRYSSYYQPILAPDGYESWENNLSVRYTLDAGYDIKSTFLYTNVDSSTINVDAINNWSYHCTFDSTAQSLFLNTLNQKKNNKIIEVIFRDELGTIVSNRREYIYKDQVYKIVEWSYDIIKKLVKAKLIMK